jgi:hypothetical protein
MSREYTTSICNKIPLELRVSAAVKLSGHSEPVVIEFFCHTPVSSQPVLLNESPAHKLIFNICVVNRRSDETGDAESGLHNEHREQ